MSERLSVSAFNAVLNDLLPEDRVQAEGLHGGRVVWVFRGTLWTMFYATHKGMVVNVLIKSDPVDVEVSLSKEAVMNLRVILRAVDAVPARKLFQA